MATRNFSSTAAQVTLSAGVNSSATTLGVSATTGFPATPFILAVDAGAAAQELVLVTNVAGANLTVTRGYDSTVAVSHDAGAVVQHSHGAIDFREANTHVNANSGVHGVTGDVVGTSDTQTLTSKTLALGSNTVSGTKAQFNTALTDGDFATLDGTETLTNKDLTSATNTLPASLPKGVLGYAQVVASQTGITSVVDLTGLSVGVTVGSSRRIRISYALRIVGSAVSSTAGVTIKEGGTSLQEGFVLNNAGAGVPVTAVDSVVLTPSAGAHTYKLTMALASGSGTVDLNATASRVAYILVEDIGSA